MKNLKKDLEMRKIKSPNKFIYNLLGRIWKILYFKKLNVHVEYKINLKDYKNKPFILIGNHASRIDYVYMGIPFLPYTLNFVCGYNEFFRSHLQGVFKLLQVIPKRNFVSDLHTVKEIDRVIKKGGRVAILPEGMSSISGANQPIALGGAKLLKHLKVPVLFTKIKGGYLTNTKYCLDERKGRVDITVDQMFSVEDLQKYSEEELTDIMNQKLYHDDYAWNKENHIAFDGKGRIAHDMHTLLYKCPKCGSEVDMIGEKDQIKCKKCGNGATVNEYYDLIPFDDTCVLKETPSKWYNWQREEIKKEIENENFELRERVSLGVLPETEFLKDYATSKIVGEGEIVLNKKGFTFTGTKNEEPFEFFIDIKSLPTYGMCTDVSRFYTFLGKEFYEFYPKTNCVAKWFLATEELHRKMGGKWQDFKFEK